MLLGVLMFLGLLTAANGTPVLLTRMLGPRLACPVDQGRMAWDGRPWLGQSKTWRGIAGSTLATGALGLLFEFSLAFSLSFGLLAMAGDLLSSFIKRRLGLQSSARATGLDQVPEALFPMLGAYAFLSISVWEVAMVVLLFIALEMTVSPLLFRLGIRAKPH
ncbi:CDP-archaeol synthase [Marinobacteraceae bacterium S3BR75-40.1]